jgi:hypothetical protein
MLVYFMAIWSAILSHLLYFVAIWPILWPFCQYCMVIWYIVWLFGIFSPRFGMLYQQKSGNPVNPRAVFGLELANGSWYGDGCDS